MTTCCPNCSSSAALGNEVASICTDCVSVSAAGASFSLPVVFAIALGAAATYLTVKAARRTWARFGRMTLAS